MFRNFLRFFSPPGVHGPNSQVEFSLFPSILASAVARTLQPGVLFVIPVRYWALGFAKYFGNLRNKLDPLQERYEHVPRKIVFAVDAKRAFKGMHTLGSF
jgi:hypothetical protein